MSSAEHTGLTPEQYAVYRCICYFDVFRFPATYQELSRACEMSLSHAEMEQALCDLQDLSLISKAGDYYFLGEEGAAMIAFREESERRYRTHKKRIRLAGRFIGMFPFVRSVSVSGSCSKGLLPKDGDFDFFVITAPGKLWICRSMLVLFKKIFLLNSKKYFCVNYFISENDLSIPDRNLFVAHEITTLMPVVNGDLHQRFINENSWTKTFLPQWNGYDSSLLARPALRLPAACCEVLLRNRFGDWLEGQLFSLTLRTWKKKFPGFNIDDFDLNMRSRKNVSKHHPSGMQNKVLRAMDERLASVSQLKTARV